MAPSIWFPFRLDDFVTAVHALHSGAKDDLDRAVADANRLATEAGRTGASASSLAGAQASAMMLLDAPHQLWMSWEGGALAVGQGEEAAVVVLTDPLAVGTACSVDSVPSALQSVDMSELPSTGSATASSYGETVAGWFWRDGTIMKGVPDVGLRVLAESAAPVTVHAIVKDFQHLVLTSTKT